MQIMLRHVQVRVPHHALDGCQLNAQSLHLRHVGMPAGMRRHHTNVTQGLDIVLELFPVVFGVKVKS